MGGELWTLFKPSNSFVILTVLGLVLAWVRWRRSGLSLASLGAIALVLWGVSPAGLWLMRPLETRFPQPQLPSEIAGIIVLGGSVMPPLTEAWDQPALNDRAERLTEAVALANRYPEAPIAFSGGPWKTSESDMSEAAVAKRFFRDMGVNNALIREAKAANTHDNAQRLAEVLPQRDTRPWILITSAYHMPRAAGLFARTGLDIIPYPVDYKTTPDSSGWWHEIAAGADGADFAAREWVALFVYYWRGWLDTPFPKPEAS